MSGQSSIDPRELAKFNATAQKWWDEDGEFKILHQINPIRLQFIYDKLQSHFAIGDRFEALDILDVGCGGGLVTVPLAQQGGKVTGVDASARNITVARQYAEDKNLSIDYLCSTVEELAQQDKQYDVILCLEIVEHVANISDFIRNIAKLLRGSGMLIVSTFNRTIKSYLLGVIAAEYILKWVPKHTHDYAKFLKPSELYRLLLDNKLHLQELKGLTFSMTTNDWRLTDDISVNYFAYIIAK